MNILKTLKISIVPFLIGVGLTTVISCNASKDPMPGPTKSIGDFDSSVGKALKFDPNSDVELVFAIDRKGKIKPFKKKGKNVVTKKLPISAGQITDLGTITYVKTTNEKLCYYDGNNQYVCIVF